MSPLLTTLPRSVLLGVAIGGIAGALISSFDLRALIHGAVIGGAISSFFGLRTQIIRWSTADAGRGDKRET